MCKGVLIPSPCAKSRQDRRLTTWGYTRIPQIGGLFLALIKPTLLSSRCSHSAKRAPTVGRLEASFVQQHSAAYIYILSPQQLPVPWRWNQPMAVSIPPSRADSSSQRRSSHQSSLSLVSPDVSHTCKPRTRSRAPFTPQYYSNLRIAYPHKYFF